MKRAIALLSIFTLCSLALVVVAAQQAPAAARFTQQDFARLKWIEGQWKGAGSAQPFYEAYRMTSPTRLESQSFADEAFATPTGNRSVYLEDGRILRDGGNSQWVAVRFTDSSIEFEQVQNASSAFVWTRKSPDAWTAILKAKGRPDTIYEMTRVNKGR